MWELGFLTTRPTKLVVPAAGIGKRFYPLTRAQPKEMLPIVDKPVIHYIIEEGLKSGLEDILVIVGAGKDAIVNYFDRSDMDSDFKESGLADLPDVYFIRQKEMLGLGDALRYAKGFVGDDPFVVLLGDTIYTTGNDRTVTCQVLDKYMKLGKSTIAVEKVPRDKISDYGIIDGIEMDSTTWKVRNLVEKPDPEIAPSDLGITGIYVLEPEIFESLSLIRPGRNGEYQLTDALSLFARDHDLYATLFSGKRFDIGTKELWIKAFFEFTKNDKRFSALIP
jgi:UTP--glucose-1-phosphate uridylyltransferase